MNQRELAKEGADLKLIFLLLIRKMVYILAAMLAGAVICGGIYAVFHGDALKNRKYTASSKYYITFEEIEDKSYFDFYYNGATWDELLSTDAILGYAMTLLPEGYDRTYVDSCIEAGLYSDVRVLSTKVYGKDEEEAILFRNAIEQAVVHYAEDGEKLHKIEVIQSDSPVLEKVSNQLLRVALIGAAAFGILMILGLLLYFAIQDAIYLPEEFAVRYPGIPIAGIYFSGEKKDPYNRETFENRKTLTNGKAYPVVDMDGLLSQSSADYEAYRKAGGVILEFPQGMKNSKKLAHALHNLEVQKCPVICAVMNGTDYRLTKHYYRLP